MYRVGVKQKMDVGHFLVGDFGEEAIPHRHDYEVEWRFAVSELDSNGFSVDIAWMRELLERVSEELRGTMLNDHPFFESRQTSVENFSRFVISRLAEIADSAYEASVEDQSIGEDRVGDAQVGDISVRDHPVRDHPVRDPQVRNNPFESALNAEVIVWETPEAWASYSIRPSDAS